MAERPNIPLRRNIELKARCDDLITAAARTTAVAQPAGTLVQIDTYFHVRRGRLKLREIAGAPAELIWYDRPDRPEFRGSDYYVVPMPDAQLARLALEAALGIRGEVRKRRELLLWHNVRIHLDQVEGLGGFVEFEAVISENADERVSHERLAVLTEALGVCAEDRIAVGYFDLMEKKRPPH